MTQHPSALRENALALWFTLTAGRESYPRPESSVLSASKLEDVWLSCNSIQREQSGLAATSGTGVAGRTPVSQGRPSQGKNLGGA